MFREEGARLSYEYDAERLYIEPWGPGCVPYQSYEMRDHAT